MKRGFGSDNHAGIHPVILKSFSDANIDHAPSYGTDEWTERTQNIFREHFGPQAQTFFVFNGTAANVTALRAMTRPYQAVLCADVAHVNVDECGAPEYFAGIKLQTLPTTQGKITLKALEDSYIRRGDQHFSQSAVLTLTQPTELGTVYSIEEIKELVDWAHRRHMTVHMDGARLANAAAYLKKSFREITTDLGVDVVSFGGTKNGLMMGEAVIFLNKDLARDFKYIRKQSAQLPSKSRFLACQFEAYLTNDLWRDIAEHSHKMAQELYRGLKDIPEVQISHPPQSNAVFPLLPQAWVKALREYYFFYVWNEHSFECRFMTSWDTQSQDIQGLISKIKELAQ